MKEIKGKGSNDPLIAIIGEAPGEKEDKLGIPFVGATGKLLNFMLSKLNIGELKNRVYYDNVIRIRPENNNIAQFIQFKQKNHRTSDVYITHRERLIKRLSKFKNLKLIIGLGRDPLYTFTNKIIISKLRGSVYMLNIPELQHVKFIPTFHPAAAFRDYVLRYYIIRDLKTAFSIYDKKIEDI